jgi:hypothetical protein
MLTPRCLSQVLFNTSPNFMVHDHESMSRIVSECVLTPMCVQEVPGPALPLMKVADFGLSKHGASLTFTRVVSNGITCTAAQLPPWHGASAEQLLAWTTLSLSDFYVSRPSDVRR